MKSEEYRIPDLILNYVNIKSEKWLRLQLTVAFVAETERCCTIREMMLQHHSPGLCQEICNM